MPATLAPSNQAIVKLRTDNILGVYQRYFSLEELFELWLALPDKRMRTLQAVIRHRHRVKVPLTRLYAARDHGSWLERAYAAELMIEAETNKAAFELVRERAVRRRAEAMGIIAEVYDENLRACKAMTKSAHYQAAIAKGGPKEMGQIIKNMAGLMDLQARIMPIFNDPLPGADGSAPPAIEGPMDPATLADQLHKLANRVSVADLRKPVIDGKAETVE